MSKSYYITKEDNQEIGLFGDSICIISNAILESKKYDQPVDIYSEKLSWEGWPIRWTQFLEVALGGDRITLKKDAPIPSNATRITSQLKPQESPYFKINWDIVNERAQPPENIEYAKTICWSRRYRRMENLPDHILNKYKGNDFLNLADDRGKNVHGLQRKYNFYTTMYIMKRCKRYIGIDSGGIHLAGCVLPPSKISIIPDPSMYRYGWQPNWQGLFYDQMGYRVELPLLNQDHHYKFLQNPPLDLN